MKDKLLTIASAAFVMVFLLAAGCFLIDSLWGSHFNRFEAPQTDYFFANAVPNTQLQAVGDVNDTLVVDKTGEVYLKGIFDPSPTHNCSVHGDIYQTVDVWTVGNEETKFCMECACTYLIKVLKENIPQITEIIKEKPND